MDWTETIDAYCERTGPEFWSEPLNAVTNAAFLIAAVIMWRRNSGQAPTIARALCIILFVIGIGSFLFHTFATAWAATADTTPIAVFILTYLYAANRHFFGWPIWGALLGTLAFFPYAALLVPVFNALPFFEISAVYWPVPLLIFAYAVIFRRDAALSSGLAIGAGILCVSLVLRSLDEPLCDAIPFGTHIWWHILNAIMLGWMIEVLRRHHSRRLEADAPVG